MIHSIKNPLNTPVTQHPQQQGRNSTPNPPSALTGLAKLALFAAVLPFASAAQTIRPLSELRTTHLTNLSDPYHCHFKSLKGQYTGTCVDDWNLGVKNLMHGTGLFKAPKFKYDGEWFNNTMHGTGTFIYKDEWEYTGHWKNNSMDGIGTYTHKDNWQYAGEWKNNQMDGTGLLVNKTSGLVYKGQWKDGESHGKGNLATTSGYIVGEWENGKPKGITSITNPNGDEIIVQVNEAGEFDGASQIVHLDGTTHEVEWKNGEIQGILQPDGQKEFTFPDGSKWNGEFENLHMTGKGVLTFTDKTTYTGEMNEGEFVQGILTYVNGDVYDGQWENGMRHGEGVFKFADGSTYKGKWEKDEMHGKGIMQLPTGDVYEGQWKAGEKFGKGILTLANGEKYEIEGKKHKKYVGEEENTKKVENLPFSTDTAIKIALTSIIGFAALRTCCRR